MRTFWLSLVMLLTFPASAEQIFVVTFEQGEAWVSDRSYELQPGISKHLAYWQNLYIQEVLLMSGPFEDQSGGLMIVRAKDIKGAIKLLDNDPAIQAGTIQAGVRRWRVLTSAMRSAKPQVIEVDPDQTFRIRRLDPDSPINLPQN